MGLEEIEIENLKSITKLRLSFDNKPEGSKRLALTCPKTALLFMLDSTGIILTARG